MNRKRSRLENMFPIEVHRADEESIRNVEVVQEVYEPQDHTSRPPQLIGMPFGETKN